MTKKPVPSLRLTIGEVSSPMENFRPVTATRVILAGVVGPVLGGVYCSKAKLPLRVWPVADALKISRDPNKPPLPGNFYEITLGTNYTPTPNVLIRPGVRFDFYSGSAKPFDDGTKNNQILFGVDAILRF